MTTNNQTTESGHYYYKDGTPAYTVPNKSKGGERPTTVRDCKKLDLVPSVTVIIACQDRPALNQWKIDQTILSCLTLPRNEGETEAEYISRLKADSKEQAKKAAQRGTEIHAHVQKGFQGEPFDVDGADKFYDFAKTTLNKECGEQKWRVEESFASEGYGGKVDLQCEEFVIDIKTTDKDLETIKTWDEHAQQLGAYDTSGKRRCGILYIHVITAESKLIWIPEEELRRGFQMFKALLTYWQYKNNIV
jgi:hypothetical protein